MITLKLLGGVKFAMGKTSLVIDKSQSTVKEIIEELKNQSRNTKILNEQNLIITVNGVDSSVTGGKETVIKSGDILTIVTIIHGG
ncbi:MAG TPA: MoaD/ThiS family protein [Nitrososphaeraceae archaeon]|nr:MoaD/ThiS family protein [Nitrososphaeraceae archaeon]